MNFMRRLLCTLLAFLWLALPASATVNSSVNRTIALGNGSQTQFTFNFIGVAATYITVILTTSGGSETVLTQGSGATQYQITLNAPVQGAIWGLGGTVTYNPSGTPIPAGSTLTIFRTLPLTQAITLQNQASIATLGKGAETGLDTGVMQGQQINEQISRAIVANITNQSPPNPLPPAAQAANQGLCFDGTGNNVIACSLAPAGVISSAMAPVVGASTLAAGRTAFGLGTMAAENINAGTCGGPSIQDDGAGNARVVPTVVADATNQAVTCNFHLTQRVASSLITYTLARASTTYFSGFTFSIVAAGSAAIVGPNASDNFLGAASGVGMTIPAGTTCSFTTNAASSATWYVNCNSIQPGINTSASANALTIAVYGTPLPFRDTTLTTGDALWAPLSSSLSIIIPSGATLGTANNVPFRIWIFVAYNSGTPILGVATCSSPGNIYGCSAWETIRKSGTGITAGATSAGALYTSANVSNTAVRIIGYVDYASGLATAGVWTSGPTTLQICAPPFVCKRPGDVVQSVQASATSVAISPTSAPNLVKFTSAVNANSITTAGTTVTFLRGASPLVNYGVGAASSASQAVVTGFFLDAPGTTASTTYSVTVGTSAGNVVSLVEEIMG